MDSKYQKVFATVFAIVMATQEVTWAEGSAGYNVNGGGASASARVVMSVTVNPRVSLSVSPTSIETDNNVRDAGVNSYSCETADGNIVSGGSCGSDTDNTVYTVTTL